VSELRDSGTAAEIPPRLVLRRVSKRFGSMAALSDAGLEIMPGEIHGLVGQNGSGKSTLIKILSGYHAPSAGAELLVDGAPVALPAQPRVLRRLGVSFVHQDLGLLDSETVAENVRMGALGGGRRWLPIRWGQERLEAQRMLATLDCSIDPRAKVSTLSASDRARVAIARALEGQEEGRGLVVFDESTRSLPRTTLPVFYAAIRAIARRGGSVLLVSHRLDEVLKIADRVTVMRDGRVVGTGPTAGMSEQVLTRMMLGFELEKYVAKRTGAAEDNDPAMIASDVAGGPIQGVDLTVAKGEIVGITGLPESGFEHLPYLLAGAAAGSGTVRLNGDTLSLRSATLRDLVDRGVALVPERRDMFGLAMQMTVLENITLPRIRSRGNRAYVGGGWQMAEAMQVIEDLDVRPAEPLYPVNRLSGGNQQKVLAGKWLLNKPRVLLLHEPTQGVDVLARRDLLGLIEKTADGGCGVVLTSIEAADLAAVCDRVLIVADGRICAELHAPLSVEAIVKSVYERAG
jgi:ribose transport system ATP-binding protein